MIEPQITTEIKMPRAITLSTTRSTAYATRDDFCRIFSEEMNTLYLLGLLLTADPAKAEQCFVAGIGNSGEGNPVFREWARSWARRTIILHAIRIMRPEEETLAIAETEPGLEIDPQLMPILKLGALERFVFVMSVLEGYSYQDCSVLLGCSRQTVVKARTRALERLANAAEIVITHRDGLQNTYAHAAN
jgi:predicted DNA-binding protein (UPF0251 family)